MHEEAHTGPIKTPKQLLLAVFFSFVIPVFAIIGLVAYVVVRQQARRQPAGRKLRAGRLDRAGPRSRRRRRASARSAPSKSATPTAPSRAARKSSRPSAPPATPPAQPAHPSSAMQRPGAHASAAASTHWSQSALKGKGAMPAQSGGDFDDIEIARAAAYMANAAGAKFAEPQRPAAAPATAAAPTACNGPDSGCLRLQHCHRCGTGLGRTPDRRSRRWPLRARRSTSRLARSATARVLRALPSLATRRPGHLDVQQGVPALVQNAMKGKGAMPPKGGSTASESEIRAAVEYMVSSVK